MRRLRLRALITLQSVGIDGGCFLVNGAGTLEATDAGFTGSVIQVGTFDENGSEGSGFLTLTGENCDLLSVALNNYGTISTPGQVSVTGSKVFANHGTIEVPLGGSLQISSNAPIPVVAIDPDTQEPTSALLARPGTINASQDRLIGGNWRVAGTLLIEGASFTSTGADPGSGSASSGYLDANGDAQMGDPTDEITKVLSYGRPANVILEGTSWNFPAILPLADNGGLFSLTNGANFSAEGSFTNRGEVLVDGSTGSYLYVPGKYSQVGTNALSIVTTGGSIGSGSGEYQILGGQMLAEKGAGVFGLIGTETSLSGVSLQIASLLHWYTNGVGDLDAQPLPCVVDLSTDGVQGQLATSNYRVPSTMRESPCRPSPS